MASDFMLDNSLISDYNFRYEIGLRSKAMKIHQETEVQKFNRLYKELDDLYHDIALYAGLSDSACSILYAVCTIGDGCLQRDICREVFISKQTINSSVRNLEKNDILYLKKDRGRDRQIFLTEKGRRLVEEKIRPVIELENDSFLGMDPCERAEFIRLSEKYVENFRKRVKTMVREQEK